jgi:DNA-binding LacI/PurR family transcriptional regulator
MRRLLDDPRPPTAVAVWSVTAAVGALAAVRRAGLSVPGEVSVVAYSDAPIAEYLEPPLATVRMPLAAMAAIAAESVIRLADGGTAADAVVDEPQPVLVPRSSTGPPPAR